MGLKGKRWTKSGSLLSAVLSNQLISQTMATQTPESVVLAAIRDLQSLMDGLLDLQLPIEADQEVGPSGSTSDPTASRALNQKTYKPLLEFVTKLKTMFEKGFPSGEHKPSVTRLYSYPVVTVNARARQRSLLDAFDEVVTKLQKSSYDVLVSGTEDNASAVRDIQNDVYGLRNTAEWKRLFPSAAKTEGHDSRHNSPPMTGDERRDNSPPMATNETDLN